MHLNPAQFTFGEYVRPVVIAFAVAASMLSISGSVAQGDRGPPTIRDLLIGQPISAQPTDFQEFACGTNGGPSSLPLTGFADFGKCRAERTGLREVAFRYDDERYYRALAARNALAADALQVNRLGNFPIVASALFDDSGILRGIRAVTDDRVSDDDRRLAYAMAKFVQRNSAGWDCTDIPAAEGETPLGNQLVKQDCRTVTDDGFVMTTQSRLLRRPGESLIDPANGQLRLG